MAMLSVGRAEVKSGSGNLVGCRSLTGECRGLGNDNWDQLG